MDGPVLKKHTGPLQLMSRSEWTAQPPKWTNPLDLPITKIFLVATSRPTCYTQRMCLGELQRIQNFHMTIPTIPDIRYNFVISGTGVVYEGRGWKNVPDLPQMYSPFNKTALYIAFTGDFRDPKIPVPADMLDAMDRLFKLGVDYKYISPDYETFDL